jgi:hypothetical protein
MNALISPGECSDLSSQVSTRELEGRFTAEYDVFHLEATKLDMCSTIPWDSIGLAESSRHSCSDPFEQAKI